MPLPDYLKIQGRRRALPPRRPSASLLTPPWTLSQLEDVKVSRPVSGDGLFYNKATNLWYNRPLPVDGFLANGMGIALVESQGLVWTDLGQIGVSVKIWSIAYLGNGIVLVGVGGPAGGRIYRSINYGATWTDLGQLGTETAIRSLAYLGNGIVVAGTGAGGKIFRSADYGATWADLGGLGTASSVEELAYLGNGIVVAGTSGGYPVPSFDRLFRSTDYGSTWTILGYSLSQLEEIVYLGQGIVLAASGAQGELHRSVDYGATWALEYMLEAEKADTRVMSLCYLGSGIVIAGTNLPDPFGYGYFFRSNGYGVAASWERIYTTAGMSFLSLVHLGGGVVLAGADYYIYPAWQPARLLRSTDFGSTWTNLGQLGAEDHILSLAYLGNGIVLAGTGDGGKIFRSALVSGV